jgi:hypothetical protein
MEKDTMSFVLKIMRFINAINGKWRVRNEN